MKIAGAGEDEIFVGIEDRGGRGGEVADDSGVAFDGGTGQIAYTLFNDAANLLTPLTHTTVAAVNNVPVMPPRIEVANAD